MAGLNIIICATKIGEYTTEEKCLGGHISYSHKTVLQSQDGIIFLVEEDHNGMPLLWGMWDKDGKDADFRGPAKGYIGVSIKDRPEGQEGEYVISQGTPDFAYSLPFARWAVALAEEGTGLLRADEEASLEGEAADIHERALSLPQVGG